MSDATPEVTEMPQIHSPEGVLLDLKSKHFPKSQEGRIAYQEYRALRFEQHAAEARAKAEAYRRADDPEFQKAQKIERLKAQLAKLEAEANA